MDRQGMNGERAGVLYVRTLGGFSLRWNGTDLTPDLGGAQTRALLQMLLHCRGGVSRDELEALLATGRPVADPHHLLQSVMYNTKKRLAAQGLPPVNYIRREKNRFFWTDEIPLEEDAGAFEAAYRAAEAAKDPAERRENFWRACGLYGGLFLGGANAAPWAAREARRYREMFSACASGVAEGMRAAGDPARMEALGRHMAQVDPLSDWEFPLLEGLIAQHRYDEALALYNETAAGCREDDARRRRLEELGCELRRSRESLEAIQSRMDGGGDMSGLCSYPEFTGIYRVVKSLSDKKTRRSYVMLCTAKDGARQDERLRGSILRSVSPDDVVCRYGEGQYLVLFAGATKKECVAVQRSIHKTFTGGRRGRSAAYSIKSI